MAVKRSNRGKEETQFPFTGKNYALFAIGFLFILLGFVILTTGDITIAPILLVAGYCVLIPAAILVKNEPKGRSETEKAKS